MDEIVVDRPQLGALAENIQQLLTHTHQHGGAAGREIEASEQLLTARFRRGVNAGGGLVAGLLLPGGDGLFQPDRVCAETLRQRFEEGDARSDGQLRVTAQDFTRQRRTGRLAAARQQIFAQFDEALRMRRGIDAPAPVQQRAAAVGNRLQQFPEK